MIVTDNLLFYSGTVFALAIFKIFWAVLKKTKRKTHTVVKNFSKRICDKRNCRRKQKAINITVKTSEIAAVI